MANLKKHGVSFEAAKLIFSDPLHESVPDDHSDNDRWRTIGCVGGTVLLVVHTDPTYVLGSTELRGRIISARKATAGERRGYYNE